jgi:hypothetical protein
MKSLIVFFLLLFAWSVSFAGADSVFVVVQGDTVRIWNTQAHTNCCSQFDFQITVSNDTIVWVERDTSLQQCNCYCGFDFNATIIGLAAGSYVVQVYRSAIVPNDTTIFIGSASFVKGPTTALYRTMRQYQSACGALGVADREGFSAPSFNLAYNYPNPFNPMTTIRFDLARASYASLTVYNVLGEPVSVLRNNERLEAGSYTNHFDGSYLASGVYYYRFVAQPVDRDESGGEQNYVSVKKMVLMK